ncbi:MAG: DUF47 family protein [Candidatus Nanoarchaeia archaeon]|nr:DUF47 family protein [Candidatus Nanoarchaeia archaeon]MDD5741638.1 DUF47 family protein [Candidatus Nanoarchaeia archaeon]
MWLIDLLLPKEVEFFRLMNKQVDIFCEACKSFDNLTLNLQNMNTQEIAAGVLKIKEFEINGDNIERFIIEKLDKTFITPLDREDIHDIVINMDKSLDLLHRVSQKIDIYHIKKAPENLIKFTQLIVKISQELKKLIYNIKNKKLVAILVKDIHKMENDGDFLFHTSVAELFNDKKNPVEVIKFKDIYQEVESIVNSIDLSAKFVRGIMMKQG